MSKRSQAVHIWPNAYDADSKHQALNAVRYGNNIAERNWSSRLVVLKL